MRANINGTEIFFDISGPGLTFVKGSYTEKPVVVAIHGGLGLDHGYLRRGLDPIADIAQIVYVDLRGHSRSGRPAMDTCTLEQMADDIAALCEHLGIKRAFIFGHSAGGFIAMHTALRHKSLVRGLLLCDSTPTTHPLPDIEGDITPTLELRANSEELALANRIFREELTLDNTTRFFNQVGPLCFAPGNEHLHYENFQSTTISFETMKYYMKIIAPSYDLRPQLRAITQPTIAMVGRHDWMCPPRASRAISQGIVAAQYFVFANSGHFPFIEEPAKFKQVVSRFFFEHSELPSARNL